MVGHVLNTVKYWPVVFVDVSWLCVEESEAIFAWHETFLKVSQANVLQRQNILLVFFLQQKIGDCCELDCPAATIARFDIIAEVSSKVRQTQIIHLNHCYVLIEVWSGDGTFQVTFHCERGFTPSSDVNNTARRWTTSAERCSTISLWMIHMKVLPAFHKDKTNRPRMRGEHIVNGVIDGRTGVCTAPPQQARCKTAAPVDLYFGFWYFSVFSRLLFFFAFFGVFFGISGSSIAIHIRIQHHFSAFFWVLASWLPPVVSAPFQLISPLAQTSNYATACRCFWTTMLSFGFKTKRWFV